MNNKLKTLIIGTSLTGLLISPAVAMAKCGSGKCGAKKCADMKCGADKKACEDKMKDKGSDKGK